MKPAHLCPPRAASRLGALAATLALTAACATATDRATAPRVDTVRALIGDAACHSDEQCRTIGVGAKACGGPAGHLAWSTLRTDGEALRTAVEQQAALQRRDNLESGRISNCQLETDPGAYCSIAPSSAGAASASSTSATGVCRLRNTRAPAVR